MLYRRQLWTRCAGCVLENFLFPGIANVCVGAFGCSSLSPSTTYPTFLPDRSVLTTYCLDTQIPEYRTDHRFLEFPGIRTLLLTTSLGECLVYLWLDRAS